MKKLNILLILLFFISCKFVPYSGNDIYNDQANLPIDEAPHFKNSLEWWYFTGHLKDVNSEYEYGVEYVLFHFNPQNKKDYLRTNFAVTNPQTGNFNYAYKILKSDTLLDNSLPLNITLSHKDIHHVLKGSVGKYAIDANIPESDMRLQLDTSPVKPILLHNGTGYEQYGKYTKAGYYSFPRLKARGKLIKNGRTTEVEGQLWYDRQWNCVGVWQKQVAWDWISIQFDDMQSELMVYRLHHFGDKAEIYGGTYYARDSAQVTLKKGSIELQEVEYWTSDHSKTQYPVKWALKIKELDIDLTIAATVPDQELVIKFTPFNKLSYWEGMCSVKGSIDDMPVTGKSYVEMTNRDEFEKKVN